VEIDWEDLDFTYYEESHATWDPDNLKYNSDYQAEGWATDSAADVTLSNRSNTEILASFSYSANTGFESVGMNFKSSQVYLASAEDGTEKTGSNTVTPTGSLPENTENAEIGTLTITIAKCEDVTERMWGDRVAYMENELAKLDLIDVYDENEAVSGEQYILSSDLTSMTNTVNAFRNEYTTLISQGQDKVNQQYYRMMNTWDNFLSTKIHTK